MRGVWRGNGIRVGLLNKEQLNAFGQAMPEPVSSATSVMNQSKLQTPIIESPLLPSGLRFQLDVTKPPYPRQTAPIIGGKNSRLRLLARIETLPTGQHQLILTPHHYIPSPFTLIPRDPYEKLLDGRVFEEMTIKLPLDENQIAVVGLHWPWPEVANQTDTPDSATDNDERKDPTPTADTAPLPPAEPADPAAPPPHLQSTVTDPPSVEIASPRQSITGETTERYTPPLPLHFGSTLFASTRIRTQVQTVLLITIESRNGTDRSLRDE